VDPNDQICALDVGRPLFPDGVHIGGSLYVKRPVILLRGVIGVWIEPRIPRTASDAKDIDPAPPARRKIQTTEHALLALHVPR
jgi:hypothetical protein